MQTSRNKYYLLNYIFVSSLIILLLNDHYLKPEFSNQLTGKLSDITGIIILPLILAYCFPKLKRSAILISALLFVFWKSPFSQSLIDLYNDHGPFRVSRVVDYSDLAVLLVLPVPYLIINKIDSLHTIRIHRMNPLLVLLPTMFALMATSRTKSYYYTFSNGNLKCYSCNFSVNYNQDDIVQKLKKMDIIFDRIDPVDSMTLNRVPGLENENAHYYKISTLVIGKDTLRDLDITMRTVREAKTKIYFNGMNVPSDITNEKLERKLRTYYRDILFRYLKSTLAN